MLKLGVRTCDLTMTLNMFHGTNTLLPLSSKGYEMDRYEKVTQKRSIPENYQVTAIEW